ncbi:Uncharacterized protein TPAR_00835 [Tolypocladium paradoxum]|uniref:Aminoglycoside phosphotransferase domain-containing protein n=1 Tax=Tolypocladium paradoxum TaxID=94208 RepID=A0A2S4L938_9HYPO|nr:Uncharacterized protein TPAR_00835 [Tolypocladium paradoxum]
MLRTICRFILVQWRWCATRTFQAWKAVLALISGRLIPRLDPSALNPLTAEQLDNRADEFVKAIDLEAVCALASSYNNDSPCRVDEKATAQGSFNVCFFAKFDDRTWVIRVPIQPVIHDAWGKLQSEVWTMRYIYENTQIPIPKVHAYGRAQLLHRDSAKQAFMILDHVEGQPLVERQLLSSPEERRRQFYSELIDIFTQLRRLEFLAGGSLMPDQPEGPYSKPAIVGAFSIPMNDLQIQGYSSSPSPSQSTTEFISQQRQLLRDFFSLPTPSLDQQTAELEQFALRAIDRIPMAVGRQHEPFVLAHLDLRPSNIMVDHELHIVGVIDWEWASTIPASLFIPPSWITASEDYFAEFRSVLASKYASSPYSQLLREWNCEYTITSRIAEIFRQPHRLGSIFYNFIYPDLFTEPRQKVVPEYFLGEQEQLELQRLLQNSERYTKYLKGKGLLIVDDEEAQRLKDLLAEVQAFYDRRQDL